MDEARERGQVVLGLVLLAVAVPAAWPLDDTVSSYSVAPTKRAVAARVGAAASWKSASRRSFIVPVKSSRRALRQVSGEAGDVAVGDEGGEGSRASPDISLSIRCRRLTRQRML